MKREIKFRAWHKVANKMLFATNEQIFYWESEGQNIDIMQFIFQLNGVDIYEGDILSAKRKVYGVLDKVLNVHETFGGDESQKIWKEWNEIVIAKFDTSECCVSFSLPKEGNTYQERGKQLKWEKIGNIYETPELLKQNNND